jgi:hypothetical protein
LRTRGASLSPEEVRYYTLVATGDEKRAQLEWAKAKLAEMDRKAVERAARGR